MPPKMKPRERMEDIPPTVANGSSPGASNRRPKGQDPADRKSMEDFEEIDDVCR